MSVFEIPKSLPAHTDSWINARRLEKYNATFEAPTKERCNQVGLHDFVSIGTKKKHFWVKIVGIRRKKSATSKGKKQYYGMIVSTSMTGIKCGDKSYGYHCTIGFYKKHMLNIILKTEPKTTTPQQINELIKSDYESDTEPEIDNVEIGKRELYGYESE